MNWLITVALAAIAWRLGSRAYVREGIRELEDFVSEEET